MYCIVKNVMQYKWFSACILQKFHNQSQNNGKEEKQLLTILIMLEFDVALAEEAVTATGKWNM